MKPLSCVTASLPGRPFALVLSLVWLNALPYGRLRLCRRGMLLNCFMVRRIAPHIDTAIPCPAERIDDIKGHAPYTLDFDLDMFAVLKRAQSFMVSPASKHVA